MDGRKKKRKGRGRCNLGFNVADLVGKEGLDAGALGEALELPQLVQLQTQLLRRHLGGALGSSWRSFSQPLVFSVRRGLWAGGAA